MLASTLSGIAAKLPKKEDAFSTFDLIGIAVHGNLPIGIAGNLLHPAGAEDESSLKKWKLVEEGNDKFVKYPDEIAVAIRQVDHDLCLVPALNGGWALRPAKKFTKNDVIMRIDGDWKKKKPETNSDTDCVYWREDFTRMSLGRISMRYWLRGKASRDLWPHVRIADASQTPTLVVIRDHNGNGLKFVAAMDLDPWSSELTAQIIVDAPLSSHLELTPGNPLPHPHPHPPQVPRRPARAQETNTSVEAIAATETEKAEEESGGHKETSTSFEEHIRKDGEKHAKEPQISDEEENEEENEESEEEDNEEESEADEEEDESGGCKKNAHQEAQTFPTHEEFDFKCLGDRLYSGRSIVKVPSNVAIIKLGEAMKDFTPASKHGRKDFPFNLGRQGIALQNGKVVDSGEWFKDNCEKEEHTVYWHKFKNGTLKPASPIFWFTATDETVARMAKLTASYGFAWSLILQGGVYRPGPA